jgi:hypothetical protein
MLVPAVARMRALVALAAATRVPAVPVVVRARVLGDLVVAMLTPAVARVRAATAMAMAREAAREAAREDREVARRDDLDLASDMTQRGYPRSPMPMFHETGRTSQCVPCWSTSSLAAR